MHVFRPRFLVMIKNRLVIVLFFVVVTFPGSSIKFCNDICVSSRSGEEGMTYGMDFFVLYI